MRERFIHRFVEETVVPTWHAMFLGCIEKFWLDNKEQMEAYAETSDLRSELREAVAWGLIRENLAVVLLRQPNEGTVASIMEQLTDMVAEEIK